jgi:hypothetical protein
MKHKAIGVKQAWSIKNYRSVCNVSGRAGLGGPGVGPDGGLGHGSEGLLLENCKCSSTKAKLIEVSPVKNGNQTSSFPLGWSGRRVV